MAFLSEIDLKYLDIDTLYHHLIDMESKKGTIKLVPILRSSLYIALYNCIESTIYSLLEEIHDKISSMNRDQLNSKLQKKLDKLNAISSKELSFTQIPQLKKYLKYNKLFSGNLDHRKIEQIFKSYDIILDDFPLKARSSIKTIKDKRNILAHGSSTFHESGRNVLSKNMKETIDHSYMLLKEYINTVEKYLQNCRYLGSI
jgi:hypothetical protein